MNVNQAPSRGSIGLVILWAMIIPQLILVALNIRGWTLIQGEANSQETNIALLILLSELAIIALCFLFFWLHRTGKIQIGWKSSLLSLVVHSTYMWLTLAYIYEAIPNSIQPWILNEGNVGRWNITLFMPGAFLSLYGLSKSFFSSISPKSGGLVVLLATLGMPLAWYLFVSIMQPAWLGQTSVIVGILFGTLVVIIFLGAVIRLFDTIVHAPFSSSLVERHYLIAALLGLAAPLCGLALNHEIAFPVNFQSVNIYSLTVINGLILILKPSDSQSAPTRLFLRCFAFPFIFYFFLVFLPFLPLSLIAILAVGAGFLMLTPLALGLFQARITLDEYSFTKTRVGQPKAILIAILGLSILPSYFLIQAVLDKNSLNTSLEYFYSHDTSGNLLSESDIKRSSNALLQLRDRKQSSQLPYISGFYNRVVFGDMVLSDTKISRMYELLTGTTLPKDKTSLFGSRGNTRSTFRRWGVLAPKEDVHIRDLEVFENSANQSTVRLTLENLSNDTHSLFVERLNLPQGVFVSGLRLKIEGDWVTGRVFDRKTALWVFQKITEVRRDPALLYYRSSNQVELRVYPFPSLGVREVELDFHHHSKIDSQISIGDQTIDLNPTFNSPSLVSQSGTPLVQAGVSSLAFQREPYLHFILDYSSQANAEAGDYANSIANVVTELNVANFRITAANIGVSDSRSNKMFNDTDIELITKHIKGIELQRVGGFWIQQAIAKEILYIDENSNKNTFRRTPIFVVISNQKLNSDKDISLDAWNWLVPDMHGWYSYTDNQLTWHQETGSETNIQTEDILTNSVIAIKENEKVSLFPANQSSIYHSSAVDGLDVYDPSINSFTPLTTNDTTTQPKSSWANYAKIWSNWKVINLSPSNIELQRSEFLERSRAENMLLPLTSFIVVESPSQWEILKRKEKQSLSNHSGLDFEEEQQTSEPPWWLLLLGLLIFLYFRERKTISAKRIIV